MNAVNTTFIHFSEPQESEPSETPAMDVLTFIQQPVERIQTYQALLKVSVTLIKLECSFVVI